MTEPEPSLGAVLREITERLMAICAELEAAQPAVDALGGDDETRRHEIGNEARIHLGLARAQLREGALRLDATATLAHMALTPWVDYGVSVFARSEPATDGDGAPTSGSG